MSDYYRYNSINIRIHSNHSAINDTDTTMDYKYLLIYVAGLFTCGKPALLIFIGQLEVGNPRILSEIPR